MKLWKTDCKYWRGCEKDGGTVTKQALLLHALMVSCDPACARLSGVLWDGPKLDAQRRCIPIQTQRSAGVGAVWPSATRNKAGWER